MSGTSIPDGASCHASPRQCPVLAYHPRTWRDERHSLAFPVQSVLRVRCRAFDSGHRTWLYC
eukprot:3313147-Rhodomonas_salina.2